MTKLRFLLFFFLVMYVVIILRLFYLQVLKENPSSEYLTTRRIPAARGNIFDRTNQTLATNQVEYKLFAEPKKVSDIEIANIKIARALNVEESTISARLDKTKDWVAIMGGLSRSQKDAIEALKLSGLGFDDEPTRYYPEGSTAAHLIGFVGKNSEDESVGYFGIEGFYDQDLGGLPGLMRSDRDLINRPIFLGTQEKIDPENGRDLVLSIDKTVQDIVKKKLKEGIDKYHAKDGCAIIADPDTMEILGLSCLPDFDQEKYYDFNEQYYKNSAISSLYEPGSTFKPFIMAAGIEEGVIRPDTIYHEKGPVTIGEYTIKTWNNTYEGDITLTRALEKSSNVAMTYVGEKLGKDKLLGYLKSYGFGELTHIDLQGEVANALKQQKDWYPIDYATVTFGQGITVSPIQMIRAFASLINGGNLLEPHVVKKLINGQQAKEIQPHVIRKVISKETSDKIKTMLVSTIANGETKYLRPEGYAIGGKTGTAQIAISGHYDASKTLASFIGFSPIKHPKFIGLVIVNEPKTSQWGSETAAPIFFQIAKELIVYYNVTPE